MIYRPKSSLTSSVSSPRRSLEGLLSVIELFPELRIMSGIERLEIVWEIPIGGRLRISISWNDKSSAAGGGERLPHCW